eukprot:11498953-Ditylum_brightwellii.AAC.1
MNFWISWNLESRQVGVGSLLCRALILWTKACASLWSSVPVWNPVDQARTNRRLKTGKTRGRKRKAKVSTTPTATTTTTAGVNFYCEMHGPIRTHNTKDCFELKRCSKHAKQTRIVAVRTRYPTRI